jgi:hypothetical protein
VLKAEWSCCCREFCQAVIIIVCFPTFNLYILTEKLNVTSDVNLVSENAISVELLN